MTKGAASKLISRPEHQGLAQRQWADGNAREQRLVLTAKGKALVPRLATLSDANDEHVFGHLPPAERRALVAAGVESNHVTASAERGDLPRLQVHDPARRLRRVHVLDHWLARLPFRPPGGDAHRALSGLNVQGSANLMRPGDAPGP